MNTKLPVIGVMGSHTEDYPELSYPLGRLICDRGCHLLTGAGGGVMTKVAKAFTESLERPGLCIGIYPVEKPEDIQDKKRYPNQFIEIPIVVPLNQKAMQSSMPYSRNMVNILSADIIIALPGWYGTKTEVAHALQLEKPLLLFGPEGAFESFPQAPERVRTIDEIEVFLDTHLKT